MVERRRLAALIRARQELVKRWSALRPPSPYRGDACTASAVAGLGRLPVDIESGRRARSRSRLVAEADQVLEGDWRVLGQHLRFGQDGPDWDRFPGSATPYRLVHFSKVQLTPEAVGGDIKVVWELHRHRELLRVAQAFSLTGEERYALWVVRQIQRWASANPPWMGLQWTSALEVSFRAIAWCWVRQLTSASTAWTQSDIDLWVGIQRAAASFLMQFDSVHHAPNTHLTGEALGLLNIGAALEELPESSTWRRRGIAILQSEVPHQFLADGMHFERATGYHRYHVEFYLHATAIARARREDWAVCWELPLRSALDVLLALRRPDGEWPVLGDEDGGTALALWPGIVANSRAVLALGAAIFDEPKWMPEEDDSTAAADWMGFPTPALTDPLRPPALTALPAAGYFAFRDDEGTAGLVDAGPHGGMRTGHAHTDIGHVELSLRTRCIIADSGSFVYGADPTRRDWDRSLSAHATVCVSGEPLAQARGAFGWSRVAPTPTVEHDIEEWGWWLRLEYSIRPGVRHQRQVVLVAGAGCVIVDWIVGQGSESVHWCFPIPHALGAVRAEGPVVTTPAGTLRFHSADAFDVRLSAQGRAPRYGEQLPATGLHVSVERQALPVCLVTTAWPTSESPGVPTILDGGVSLVIPSHTGGLPRQWELAAGSRPRSALRPA